MGVKSARVPFVRQADLCTDWNTDSCFLEFADDHHAAFSVL